MTDEQRDIVCAVADLSTRMTVPSALGVFDWVTGRRASRGETDPRGGPAPWFGLEPVLRQLEADGLVELLEAAQDKSLPDAGTASPAESVRVRLTDRGRRTVGR